MGLDMYFYARKTTYKSFAEWDPSCKVDKTNYPEDLKVFSDYIYDRNFKSVETKVDYQIGYFRKFNALHAYIVRTFANGKDNCQDIFLSQEAVVKIKAALDSVLEPATEEKAKEVLPTQSGFFFGDISYDEYYFEDVREAAALMQNFLDHFDFDTYELIYRASW